MEKRWSPGINHIEYWVSDLSESMKFYEDLFSIIGWRKIGGNGFSTGTTEIYFKQMEVTQNSTYGPRHICFQAVSKEIVDDVYANLTKMNARIIRGPIEMNHYSDGYYTVDFYDPDGYVLEVAYTPNMVL